MDYLSQALESCLEWSNMKYFGIFFGLAMSHLAIAANFMFAPKTFGFAHEDLMYHFVVFMVPMGYWFFVFRDARSRGYLVLICLVAAPGVETLQQLSRYHVFDWLDVGANAVGGMFGAVITSLSLNALKRRQ